MDPKSILIERQDHIFTITLNRPDKLNAFINDMLVEVREAVTGADADPETRTIIITGAGRAFSAGADLNAFKSALEESKRQGRQVTGVDQQLLAQFAVEMDRLSTPVIAAINGPAVGVGFTLPLACDIRIASERATLGGVFVRVASRRSSAPPTTSPAWWASPGQASWCSPPGSSTLRRLRRWAW